MDDMERALDDGVNTFKALTKVHTSVILSLVDTVSSSVPACEYVRCCISLFLSLHGVALCLLPCVHCRMGGWLQELVPLKLN